MTVGAKRFVIGLLALFFLGFVCVLAWQDMPRPLWAQEVATNTPTYTPSYTPTPTITWTPTPTGSATWTPTFTATPTPPGFFSPLGTPTLTPTNEIVTRIDQPSNGDAVAGLTSIVGSALTSAFRMYELHISPAGAQQWSWLYNSFSIVAHNELYLWNTVPFADGFYDIRLRSIRDNGQYIDYIVYNVEVRNANPPTTKPYYNAQGTFVPSVDMESLFTPTPTIPPRIQMNNERGQGIFEPEIGETVWGFVDIVGTTNGSRANPFDRYEVAISTAGDMNWNWLYTSEDQVWQNVVYTLDSRDWPDGSYDIRLRLVYRDANYDDFILRYIQIANAGAPDPADKYPNGIYRPKSGKKIGGMVNVVGTALDRDFMRWELHWSPAGAEQWNYLTEGDRQIARRVLARIDVSPMLGQAIDLRLRVVRSDFNYDEYFRRDLRVIEPTPTPTWYPSATPEPPAAPTATPTPFLPPQPSGPEPTWTPLG